MEEEGGGLQEWIVDLSGQVDGWRIGWVEDWMGGGVDGRRSGWVESGWVEEWMGGSLIG